MMKRVFYLPALGAFFLASLTQAQQPDVAITPGKLSNISARTLIQGGDSVGIGGFIVSDSGKRLLLRGLGPSLPLANRLANPVLTLYNAAGTVITSNDDWRSDQRQEIEKTGLEPSSPLESAIIATLPNASYTAILRGTNDGTGLGLLEIYDLEPNSLASELTNLSARGFVGTGDNVLIAGLVIEGATSPEVLIRALGPTLTEAHVPNALQNPALTLYNENGDVVQMNDNWKTAPNIPAILATSRAPGDDRESAILIVLTPGRYTAIVRGVGGTTGNALAEVYRFGDG